VDFFRYKNYIRFNRMKWRKWELIKIKIRIRNSRLVVVIITVKRLALNIKMLGRIKRKIKRKMKFLVKLTKRMIYYWKWMMKRNFSSSQLRISSISYRLRSVRQRLNRFGIKMVRINDNSSIKDEEFTNKPIIINN
jgi:hypothetical protein